MVAFWAHLEIVATKSRSNKRPERFTAGGGRVTIVLALSSDHHGSFLGDRFSLGFEEIPYIGEICIPLLLTRAGNYRFGKLEETSWLTLPR